MISISYNMYLLKSLGSSVGRGDGFATERFLEAENLLIIHFLILSMFMCTNVMLITLLH